MSALGSVPPAAKLAADYHRHAPDRDAVRHTVTNLVTTRPWAELTWSELMEALIGLGRTDIPLARRGEGHIDAVRILGQAGREPRPDALYGVWASRSRGSGLTVRHEDRQLVLNGVIRFASGAGVLDRALVPIWPGEGHHVLVDIPVAELEVNDSAWQTAAMRVSRTHAVRLSDFRVPTLNVIGRRNFYLDRPGFFPGGIGVAAVWAGGTMRILDAVLAYLDPAPWPAGELRLGRLTTQVGLAVAAVRDAGRQLDELWAREPRPGKPAWQQLATLVRAGVGTAVRAVLDEARALAGPVGLAMDADLTHAIDDLGLYVMQQNADADAAYLGAGLR